MEIFIGGLKKVTLHGQAIVLTIVLIGFLLELNRAGLKIILLTLLLGILVFLQWLFVLRLGKTYIVKILITSTISILFITTAVLTVASYLERECNFYENCI